MGNSPSLFCCCKPTQDVIRNCDSVNIAQNTLEKLEKPILNEDKDKENNILGIQLGRTESINNNTVRSLEERPKPIQKIQINKEKRKSVLLTNNNFLNLYPVKSKRRPSKIISKSPEPNLLYKKTKTINKTEIMINIKMDEDLQNTIKRNLIKHNLINTDMEDSLIQNIMDSTKYFKVKNNSKMFVYQKNNYHCLLEHQNKYYIIIKGEVTITINTDKVYTYGRSTLINTKLLTSGNNSVVITSSLDKNTYVVSILIKTYDNLIKDYNEKNIERKINILKSNSLFCSLDKASLLNIVSKIKEKKYSKKHFLILEGEINSSLFILIDGVVLLTHGKEINNKVITCNYTFGEINLFYKIPNYYSYCTEDETFLFEITYSDLQSCIANTKIKNTSNLLFYMFTDIVKNSYIFSKYFSAKNMEVFYKLFTLKYYSNQTVINKFETKILVLISGSLYTNGHKILNIGVVGNIILHGIMNNKISVSANECLVLEANWVEITKIIKSFAIKQYTLYELINLLRKTFSNTYNIKNLSEMKLLKLAELCQLVHFNQDDIIFKGGPAYNKFYIVLSGKVSELIEDERELKTIEEGQAFGDIFKSTDKFIYITDYKAKMPTDCLFISKKDYEGITDFDSIKNFNKFIVKFESLTSEKNKNEDILEDHEDISLDKLFYIKDLGEGSYGKVYLVTDKKQNFGLKTACIDFLNENEEQALFYLNEKEIMLELNFPFIVKLYKTFKTREYLFFLMEFINGINIREFLEKYQKNNLRNLDFVQFYGATLFLILDYLENKRILHRDLKPENLLLDQYGYLKVIDFGIAKDISGKNYSCTVIGTHHYMAPEVISGHFYSFPVDYWSVGIILYEIFYGKVPFGFGFTDPLNIYKEIQHSNPIIPSDKKNEKFNDLIRKLLKKNPQKRLSNLLDVKHHPFFENFDFDKLLKKKLEPKFIPPKSDFEDVKNSDNLIGFQNYLNNNLLALCNDINAVNNMSANKDPSNIFADF